MEQLQAVRVGQERTEAGQQAAAHRQHLRLVRSGRHHHRQPGHPVRDGTDQGV